MKRTLIALLALTIITGSAFADGPGGPGGQNGGPRPGDGGPGGPGAGIIVGSDGSAYVTKSATDTAGVTTTTLSAITAAGATAWTVTLAERGPLVLSGTTLFTESETRATDGTVTSTLTGRSTTSGAVLWTKTFTGHLGDLRPVNGGVYGVLSVPPATTGAAPTRSLVSISSSGATLFTVAL
jgi:hypothetical protein